MGVIVQSQDCVRLFATPWTVAHQTPLSMGFSRPEYWSGLPFPPPGDLPDPGIEPGSPSLQVVSLPAEPRGKPRKPWTQEGVGVSSAGSQAGALPLGPASSALLQQWHARA